MLFRGDGRDGNNAEIDRHQKLHPRFRFAERPDHHHGDDAVNHVDGREAAVVIVDPVDDGQHLCKKIGPRKYLLVRTRDRRLKKRKSQIGKQLTDAHRDQVTSHQMAIVQEKNEGKRNDQWRPRHVNNDRPRP